MIKITSRAYRNRNNRLTTGSLSIDNLYSNEIKVLGKKRTEAYAINQHG